MDRLPVTQKYDPRFDSIDGILKSNYETPSSSTSSLDPMIMSFPKSHGGFGKTDDLDSLLSVPQQDGNFGKADEIYDILSVPIQDSL
jgi:hypothetical protein